MLPRPLTSTRLLPALLLLWAAVAQGQAPTGGLDSQKRDPLATDDDRSALQALPPEEAFRLSAGFENGRMLLDWEIAPGYYLYRKSFRVREVSAGEASFRELPAGEVIEDPFFGEVSIYRQQVQTVLAAHATPAGRLSLTIEFQGCAESRYCYPVMTRVIDVHVR